MTAAPPYCAGQGCPGEADQDGFCRRSGFACPAFTTAPPAGNPLATGKRLAVPPSEPVPPMARRYPVGSGRPWEQSIVITAVPIRDLAGSTESEVIVPEHARWCGNTSCRKPIGSRVSGYCRHCGTPYAFHPPLAKGDLRADRYRIERCLGHGGLGWVFLARDQQMLDVRRVLKGLRNPSDPAAAEAFAQELQALVALNHPNIVTVTHVLPLTAQTDAVYLVMEYVNGGTLEDLRATAGPDGGPAAVDAGQVLDFGDAILDALGYLHDNGWLYCDLKPENVMLSDAARIKLVDFGAVRRAGDRTRPPWGSPGFQAPEIDLLGPAGATIRSDIYTVGRTLAALALANSTEQFAAAFPPGARDWHTVPVQPRLDPFLRLVARATATAPAARFSSAAEMREQVAGVRRQVQATDQVPQPARSAYFGPFRRAFGDHVDSILGLDREEAALGLPVPLVDAADPAASFLASIGSAEPDEVLAFLEAAPERSSEVVYLAVRTQLAAGQVDRASELLDGLPDGPRQWCRSWHRGLVALVAGDTKTARKCFDAVYDWLPGEVSARLGYAVACELDGTMEQARDHYHAVWRTDRAADSAAFGLARALLVAPWPGDVSQPGDGREQAVDILRQVSDSSHASTAAGVWAVRLLLHSPAGDGRRTSLERAADIASRLKLSERDRELLRALVLRTAVDGKLAHSSILGCPPGLDNLRRDLDRTLRSLASRTPDRRRRVALVDLANEYRPESWL